MLSNKYFDQHRSFELTEGLMMAQTYVVASIDGWK